jgi:hypothetical protein
MPRPGRKEDDSVIGFNLRAEIQLAGHIVRSIIGEHGKHPSGVGEGGDGQVTGTGEAGQRKAVPTEVGAGDAT